VGVILPTHLSPEYLAHREGIKGESACGKCIEMETQLKEAVIELSSAQLIIEILQKGSNMSTSPEHVFIFIRIVACTTLDLSNYILQNYNTCT